MKSRTSFSKLTSFKKDLTRFLPLPILYFVAVMLVLFSNSSFYEYADEFAYRHMSGMIMGFGIVNICYAAICALAFFNDLYQTRLCYSLHALPQRRESWLLSHFCAGLLYSLVPNLLAALFLMTRLENLWFLALYWLLAATVQFLFFYSLAILSAMLTGNRLAMLLVYAGFNFVSMLLFATVQMLYIPTLTGVVINIADFTPFSPVVHQTGFQYFNFKSYEVIETAYNHLGQAIQVHRVRYEYLGLADGWGYLAILGGMGVVALAIAWWLYRKRHLESAGDFVAFPKIKGVACVVITLCVMLCMALMGKLFDEDLYIFWMIAGLVIGFFGSLMLLERRVKVFRKKTFLGFGSLALVVALSFAMVAGDWLGIERWTPEADRVESVTIANYKKTSFNSFTVDYNEYYGNRITVGLTDPQDIQQVITAHEDILARLDTTVENTHRVTIRYTMKSGREVIRSYIAPADGLNYQIFLGYFNSPQQVLGYGEQSWEEFVRNVDYLNVNYQHLPEALAPKLLEALREDCAKGAVTLEPYSKEYVYTVEYRTENSYRNLFVSDQATATLELLKQPEYVLGYVNWGDYIHNAQLHTNGFAIEDAEGFLTAVRQDVLAGNVTLDRWRGDELIVISVDYDGFFHEILLKKTAENALAWLKANGFESIVP